MDLTSSIIFFIVFTVICFVILVLAKYIFQKDGIFTLAIGAVIGANIYNSSSHPIYVGDLILGMDAVIYTIFLFCTLIMFVQHGKQSFLTLLYTALFSIFFSALLSLFGTCATEGFISKTAIMNFVPFLISMLGSFVACMVMILLFGALKNKNCNEYVNIIICLIVANLINSVIYFSLSYFLTGNLGEEFIASLLGSIIIKLACVCFCVVVLLIENKFIKKKNTNQFLKKPNKKVKK